MIVPKKRSKPTSMPAPVLASPRRCLLGARNPTWQGDTNWCHTCTWPPTARDGPKPTNRAYAREPRAAPQSHDSRVDCTSGCCDRGASLELLPAHEQIKRARQCHLHAPANRARSPNPTTIARAETRTARQRWPRPTASALAPAHEKQLQCVIQQAPSPRVECAPVIIPGLSRRIRRRRGATTGNHVAYVTVFSKPPVAPIRL